MTTSNDYIVLKSYKGLELIKFSEPISGGLYGVSYPKERKAKIGLCLDAAVEVFENCLIRIVINL